VSNFKRIGQITAYRPLARLNMEELAAYTRSVEPRGGILFARGRQRAHKDAARQRVLDLFTPTAWPGWLHLLTMPGVDWRFERLLLGLREPGWMQYPGLKWPARTHFMGVESDRPIYFAAVGTMPGVHTPHATIKPIKPFPFAEIGVKTRYASLFLANVDDVMMHAWTDNGWDAAWLDYTGPLTVERLAIIARFYRERVRHIMIVTAMLARWNKHAMDAIEHHGGHSAWMRAALPGHVLHEIEYLDTSPMVQFAVRHEGRGALGFWEHRESIA
jgi:hypothetical protein